MKVLFYFFLALPSLGAHASSVRAHAAAGLRWSVHALDGPDANREIFHLTATLRRRGFAFFRRHLPLAATLATLDELAWQSRNPRTQVLARSLFDELKRDSLAALGEAPIAADLLQAMGARSHARGPRGSRALIYLEAEAQALARDPVAAPALARAESLYFKFLPLHGESFAVRASQQSLRDLYRRAPPELRHAAYTLNAEFFASTMNGTSTTNRQRTLVEFLRRDLNLPFCQTELQSP